MKTPPPLPASLWAAPGGLPPSEAAEAVAAALANLAVGGAAHRDAIVKVRGGGKEGRRARERRRRTILHVSRSPPTHPITQAGAIPPLVLLLRGGAGDLAAELAAVALRNAALRCGAARRALRAAKGLKPLLRVLGAGTAVLDVPMAATAWFEGGGGGATGEAGVVLFDAAGGAARWRAARGGGSAAGRCFGPPPPPPDPRQEGATVYPLLDRLTVTEAGPDALDVVLAGGGAAAVVEGWIGRSRSRRRAPTPRRLVRLRVEPCAATDVKGALMRVLTRLHVEREFGRERE